MLPSIRVCPVRHFEGSHAGFHGPRYAMESTLTARRCANGFSPPLAAVVHNLGLEWIYLSYLCANRTCDLLRFENNEIMRSVPIL